MAPSLTMLRVFGGFSVLVLACASALGAEEVTFEDLRDGPAAGQGGWQDYDGEPSLLTVQTLTPAHLGQATRVLASATGSDFVTLRGEAPLGVDAKGGQVVQVDVRPGASALIEISVGHDLDVKPAKGGGDGRRGPSLGFVGPKFMLRSANPNAMVSADASATDDRNDWYRLRLVIDFAANGGNGAGTLQVRNLTDGEQAYRTVLSGVDLQIKARMAAISRDPATWNAWLVRMNGAGAMADNLGVIPTEQP